LKYRRSEGTDGSTLANRFRVSDLPERNRYKMSQRATLGSFLNFRLCFSVGRNSRMAPTVIFMTVGIKARHASDWSEKSFRASRVFGIDPVKLGKCPAKRLPLRNLNRRTGAKSFTDCSGSAPKAWPFPLRAPLMCRLEPEPLLPQVPEREKVLLQQALRLE
jgi:hypothetical protein